MAAFALSLRRVVPRFKQSRSCFLCLLCMQHVHGIRKVSFYLPSIGFLVFRRYSSRRRQTSLTKERKKLISVLRCETMVWGKLVDTFGGEPKLPSGPTKLPDYFPVEPAGCEKHAQKLFSCLANEATQKARDMEKAGLHKSYFDDVTVKPGDEKAAKLVAENGNDPSLPKAGDNPLDECRLPIGYYRRCCERELKKRKNWILTEPYRVQEEYRYAGENK